MEQTIEPGDKSAEKSSNHKQETVPIDASIPISVNNPHRAPGKKIRTYLFEFLMLFLAVFCGFIADNWREKLSEHQREKTFISSIVEDIKSDTLQSGKVIKRLKVMHNGIDSVLMALSSPDVLENSNYVYRIMD